MSVEFPSNFLLAREQSLVVGDHVVKVHRTELIKSNLSSFELVVEVSRDVDFINELFSHPTKVRGTKVQCVYEGVEATAELSMFTKDENVLNPDIHVLHFVCSNIETLPPSGEKFQFLLPHVHFGSADFFTVVENPDRSRTMSRDHLKFSTGGKEWTLRHLIEFEHVFYTAEEAVAVQRAAGVKVLHLEPSGHAALEVSCDEFELDKAMETATDICWLLHLALGQRVAWSELHVVTGTESQFVARRASALPDEPSGANPIRNWCDGALKRFIENGWPVFQQDAEWWRVSLNWFSIASENAALESSAMIYCMLFDRLSTHLLEGIEFPKQISEKLTKSLGDDEIRGALIKELGDIFNKYTDNWDNYRSVSLVEEIERRNNSLSYSKKVAEAYSRVELKSPTAKFLRRRNNLMHEGGIKLPPDEALEFLMDLHQYIVTLMLCMLKYQGKFFSLGRGEQQLSEFLLDKSEVSNPSERKI